MGEVYEATHSRLSGRYAIKVLLRELASQPDAFARFRREAEITSALRHPNIVQVIDSNVMEDDSPYLVMEFLDGVDLATRLEKGPLPLSTVLPLVKQIASGLGAAHRRGIVHRDLKPQNIFLVPVEGEDGEEFAKILDFGISKMKSANKSVTRDSVVLGTPQYMSPEQAMGKIDQIDDATDQFALGAITYEMISGRQAFAGEDALAVMYQVVNGSPAPLMGASAGRGVAAIEAVLRRALAKTKSDRYASVTDFARALTVAAAGAEAVASKPYDRFLTPAPTIAFGHLPAPTPVPPASEAPATEERPPSFSSPSPVQGAPHEPAPRTPTTFRSAVGELSPPPHRRTRAILAVAGGGLTLVAGIAVLALVGRSQWKPPAATPLSGSRPSISAPAQLPMAPAAPAAVSVPAPTAEAAAVPTPAEGPPPEEASAAAAAETPAVVPPEQVVRAGSSRRSRSHIGSSGSRRDAKAEPAASAAPAATPAAPQPETPPPPAPKKPPSDLVKGDDL
jgi:serine/threonine-protein kinase